VKSTKGERGNGRSGGERKRRGESRSKNGLELEEIGVGVLEISIDDTAQGGGAVFSVRKK